MRADPASDRSRRAQLADMSGHPPSLFCTSGITSASSCGPSKSRNGRSMCGCVTAHCVANSAWMLSLTSVLWIRRLQTLIATLSPVARSRACLQARRRVCKVSSAFAPNAAIGRAVRSAVAI